MSDVISRPPAPWGGGRGRGRGERDLRVVRIHHALRPVVRPPSLPSPQRGEARAFYNVAP
jgi:hypothetical protein